MKAAQLVCLSVVLATRIASAEDIDVQAFEYIDVVETTDGSILKGVVIEQEPGIRYKVATADGSVHVIKAPEVVKLSKERNKLYRPTRVAALGASYGGGDAAGPRDDGPHGSLPAPLARTGLRVDVDATLVFPTGDIKGVDTSYAPTIRVGYEHLAGNFGISGGGLVRYTYWILPDIGDGEGDALWTLETHGYVQGALHIGRVAPYLGASIGLDTNYAYSGSLEESDTEVGFGMNLGFGVAVAASPSVAFDFGADYHPATDNLGSAKKLSIEYTAMRAGASFRF